MMRTKHSAGYMLWCLLLLSGCSQQAALHSVAQPAAQSAVQPEPVLMLSAAQQQQFEQAKQLLQAADFSAALAMLQPLFVQLPQATGIGYNLALSQWHSGDIDGAQQTLAQLVGVAPHYSDGHNLAGVLARQQGQFRQAERHFQQALQVQSNYASAHKNLAFLYELYLGAPQQAHYHYKQYIALTQDEQAKVWLALLEQQLAQEQVND
jgi:tetratricopeptide (TPR) repeat protein